MAIYMFLNVTKNKLNQVNPLPYSSANIIYCFAFDIMSDETKLEIFKYIIEANHWDATDTICTLYDDSLCETSLYYYHNSTVTREKYKNNKIVSSSMYFPKYYF